MAHNLNLLKKYLNKETHGGFGPKDKTNLNESIISLIV